MQTIQKSMHAQKRNPPTGCKICTVRGKKTKSAFQKSADILLWYFHRIMTVEACTTDRQVTDHVLELFDRHVAQGVRSDLLADFLGGMGACDQLLVGRHIGSKIAWKQKWWRTDSYMHLSRSGIFEHFYNVAARRTAHNRIIDHHNTLATNHFFQGIQFNVKDTQKYGQVFGHIGELEQGSLKVGQTVNAVVDAARRHQTSLNHSATHLLHAALRQVLGHHVVQKGSLVSDTALRFDFAHPEAITKAQLNEIETLVNQKVRENFVVQTDVMDIEAAKGAMALFGEKYADVVRVLTMGDFSVELCGGIHAKRTGDIGLFKIVAETAVAAGVRRIEAVTGENAINWLHNQQRILAQSADLFKSDVNTLVEKIQQLQDKAKKAEKELQGLKEKAAMQAGSDLVKSAVKINDVSVIVHQLDGIETKSLRVMVDDLKNQLGSGVIVFASILDDKVNLVVGVTSDLTTKVKAGELVNLMAQQVGGKGGGRPDMAMAGGSQPENVNLALTVAQNWLSNNL